MVDSISENVGRFCMCDFIFIASQSQNGRKTKGALRQKIVQAYKPHPRNRSGL
jgi:hypothetical protein